MLEPDDIGLREDAEAIQSPRRERIFLFYHRKVMKAPRFSASRSSSIALRASGVGK